MTREEIMRMEGHELDAAVAEYVMGLSVSNGRVFSHYEEDEFGEVSAVWVRVPRYCSDIAAAWQVVERLTAMGCQFDLSFAPDYAPEPWLALFFVPPRGAGSVYSAYAKTATEAISRAALLAVCGEGER